MGKYRRLSPDMVANIALSNLIAKIPQMQSNYSSRMSEFAYDPEAQGRYRAGVAEWITVMRSPDVRSRIAEAILEAKRKLRERLGIPVVAPKPKVPVYA